MKNNTLRLITALALISAACAPPVLAQGTAFTYQGRLLDGNGPGNGTYDLRFILYDNIAGGSQQGPILTNTATAISNGLFTVTLDFGNQFPGAGRWMEIAVRTNGAVTFTTLSSRQPVTPAPYAITADNIVSGGIPSGTYSTSDRNAKENFSSVSGTEILDRVLSLRVTRWNFKSESDKEHIGPMAQDFHEAFGLNGADDKHISMVDEGGVALAAIQGLNRKLEERTRQLETENAELKQTVAELKNVVADINGRVGRNRK